MSSQIDQSKGIVKLGLTWGNFRFYWTKAAWKSHWTMTAQLSTVDHEEVCRSYTMIGIWLVFVNFGLFHYGPHVLD